MIKCEIMRGESILFTFKMPKRSVQWWRDHAAKLTGMVRLFNGDDMRFMLDK